MRVEQTQRSPKGLQLLLKSSTSPEDFRVDCQTPSVSSGESQKSKPPTNSSARLCYSRGQIQEGAQNNIRF